MPEISRFFGFIVTMYFNDHPPAHFHAKYSEHKAKIAIESGKICWSLAMAREAPGKIEPLE